MTKYYYLKLGTGNCLAEYWLNPEGKRSIYKEEYEHAAAIYFGRNTVEDIIYYAAQYKKGGASKEEALRRFKDKLNSDKDKTSKPDVEAAIHFVKAGEKSEEKTCFVTITQKKVYIYEPGKNSVFNMSGDNYDPYDDDLKQLSKASKMRALTKSIESMKVRIEGNTEPRNIPKIMPVRFLKELPIAEVPHVLASLSCNQYLSQGTCREIVSEKNWGAIQAIKHCLNEQIDQPECAHELMNFLSSYELETLVFLILTNAGLFVPAWRGGTQKGFDMIAYNVSPSAIKKLQLPVESEDRSKSSFTFQVKKGKVKKHSEFADFTIATKYDGNNNRILNAEWLLRQIKNNNQSKTREWFSRLLYWIPNIDPVIDQINC